MGNSRPPAADIDLVGSYVRRRADVLELVLAGPEHGDVEQVVLRSRDRNRRVVGPARLIDDEHGKRLVATVPVGELADGQWAVAVRSPDGGRRRVAARVLVQGDRPAVLLWGREPGASEVPRRATPTAPPTASQRAAARGGRALDGLLRMLPPERAHAVRERLRAAARRTSDRVSG